MGQPLGAQAVVITSASVWRCGTSAVEMNGFAIMPATGMDNEQFANDADQHVAVLPCLPHTAHRRAGHPHGRLEQPATPIALVPFVRDDLASGRCGYERRVSHRDHREGRHVACQHDGSAMTDQTTELKSEPDADWNNIWTMMNELGAAMAPLLDLASPPSWAITMRFAMDVALPEIEEKCAEITDDE
jgi:hypothetical protein